MSEGTCLDWKRDYEECIAGSIDGNLCTWDMNQQSEKVGEKVILQPKNNYRFHPLSINDVKFHKTQSFIFACASDH